MARKHSNSIAQDGAVIKRYNKLTSKLLSFDLEISEPFVKDPERGKPLGYGISCCQLFGYDVNYVWAADEGQLKLSREACVDVVETMESLAHAGATIVTHNGMAFDFRVLAEQSGLVDRCARLAFLHHFDTMFAVTRVRGHFVGLKAVCEGMGVPSKRSSVELNDGTIIHDMDGKKAPEMWANGERKAVLHYLEGDCIASLACARAIRDQGVVRYTFKKGGGGNLNLLTHGGLRVIDALQAPREKVAWIKFAYPYTRMFEWSGVNLYFVYREGIKYRVPGVDEMDARSYAGTMFDLYPHEESALRVEKRWENEVFPRLESDISAEARATRVREGVIISDREKWSIAHCKTIASRYIIMKPVVSLDGSVEDHIKWCSMCSDLPEGTTRGKTSAGKFSLIRNGMKSKPMTIFTDSERGESVLVWIAWLKKFLRESENHIPHEGYVEIGEKWQMRNNFTELHCTSSAARYLIAAPNLDDQSHIRDHQKWWEMCSKVDPSMKVEFYDGSFTLTCNGMASRHMPTTEANVNALQVVGWIHWLAGFTVALSFGKGESSLSG